MVCQTLQPSAVCYVWERLFTNLVSSCAPSPPTSTPPPPAPPRVFVLFLASLNHVAFCYWCSIRVCTVRGCSDVKHHVYLLTFGAVPELRSCAKVEVAIPNSLYVLCGRKATLQEEEGCWILKAQELCESRGGRPGIPVPNTVIFRTISVDIKQH